METQDLMRVRWERTAPDGTITAGETYFNGDSQPPHGDVLAYLDLETMTLRYKDGTTVLYHAVEYECEFCLDYTHRSEDCPNRDEDEETPCSEDCLHGVDKGKFADEYWHHQNCPNHTIACCGYGLDQDAP